MNRNWTTHSIDTDDIDDEYTVNCGSATVGVYDLDSLPYDCPQCGEWIATIVSPYKTSV